MKISSRVVLINTLFALTSLVAIGWYLVGHQSEGYFATENFMPHGHCYLWSPVLVWTMVTTDLLIGLAYVSISLCLYILVRRIRLPFSAMFLAFGMFIAACGATHFMEIYTLWSPNYWLAALVKVITAIASVATAVIMFPLFPKIVEFAAAARLSEDRKNQLEVLNRELQLKTDALEQANRELETFSYSVSHDLRSPLRGIDGFSRALAEDYAHKLDGPGQEYLQFIRSGAQRMGQIIDDLLDLARVTKREIFPQLVDLSQIAKEALQVLASNEPVRHVEVFVQEALLVTGDAGLLRLVMENLLSNAWKFSSQQIGARIEVGAVSMPQGAAAELKAIENLPGSDSSESLTYFVRDNGVGFDMAYAGKLFGAFQRMHSEAEFVGTGVGLATCKRIIERHGGSIHAESAPGQGTTFYFTIGVL